MNPERAVVQPLKSSLDRLAESGLRHMKRYGVRRVLRTRAAALSLFDRQFELHDRLVTADEFIHRSQVDGFAAAAIDDAARFIAPAEQAGLNRIEIASRAGSRRLRWAAGAAAVLLALVVALWLTIRPDVRPEQNLESANLHGTPEGSGASTGRDEPKADAPEIPAPRPSAGPAQIRARGSSDPSMPSFEGDPQGDAAAGSSMPAQAGTARPSDASAGWRSSPSDRAAPHEGAAEPPRAAASSSRGSTEAPGTQAESTHERQTHAGARSAADFVQQESPTQPLSGSASTAHRAGAALTQQGASSEEPREDAASPEGARAAGGTQPPRRSQQADAQSGSSNPGSSPISQGKGQGSSQDALKKSRGVASMILGVPMPDRIQGLPHPGPVRILQKKTAPKEEHASVIEAESRAARTNPVGKLEPGELQPWMRSLVREYFSRDPQREGQP